MKRITSIAVGIMASGALLFAPSAAEAQLAGSITGGIVGGTGDTGDVTDSGFTVQGRAELSILFAGVHANAGFTRLNGADSFGDADFWNAGVGARLGLGTLLWVGANANYYLGDDIENEVGIVPEVGVSLGPLEAIADFKITGDVNFWSLRAGIRF